MMTLMEQLESFNRKERFFLIGDVLGNRAFELSTDFRARLSEVFGIEPPSGAFVAMDYHLDWIHASLFFTLPGNDDEAVHLKVFYPEEWQGRIDLVEPQGAGRELVPGIAKALYRE